ncbi:MAG: HD domain-containing protein [Candidatus Pacearchaeota archaeon]
MLLEAIRFADRKHKGQRRKVSGKEYFTHPLMVSYLIAKYKRSKNLETLLTAAILHDTIEDTKTKYSEILSKFGADVVSLVSELTSCPEEIARLGKNEYLKRKMVGISSYALVIKLSDRLSNCMDNPTDEYKKDTVELLNFLKRNRKLSKTHRAIIRDIEAYILWGCLEVSPL